MKKLFAFFACLSVICNAYGQADQPDDREVILRLIKGNRFLLSSPRGYQSHGVDTTKLYHQPDVALRQRYGAFQFGTRTNGYRVRPQFSKQVLEEFLLPVVVDNLMIWRRFGRW